MQRRPATGAAPAYAVSGTSLATKIGCGLVSGLGLRSGAIATTIAHDAHHLLVVGVDPADMLAAARAVAAAGGGLAVVKGDMAQVLPLPLAGLMADLPVGEVAAQLRSLERAAGSLGVDFEEPFMVLSFITLSVIPRLRLTLDGLLGRGRADARPRGGRLAALTVAAPAGRPPGARLRVSDGSQIIHSVNPCSSAALIWALTSSTP